MKLRVALFALLLSALTGCGALDTSEVTAPAPVQAQQAASPAPEKKGPNIPKPEDTVRMFDPSTVEWREVPLSQVPAEGEFIFDGHLMRLRGAARVFQWGNTVNVGRLAEADRPFQKGPHLRLPSGSDVVRTLGTKARHCLLSEVIPGEEFLFQGRLFETRAAPTGELEYQDTGRRFSRVTRTFKREADTLVDLTVRYESTGKERVISGTVEHPFFVPSLNDYVPLKDLAPGTVLKTDDGSIARVVKSSTRRGDFAVHNIEVEGAHNYYVSAPDAGTPAVLVHNTSTLKPGPYAKESIPAHRGRPTAAEQRQVNELMNKHGCHTCGTKNPGTKSGNAIADHQPPQALDEPVEFLPHCNDCKARQGGEVLQEMIRRAKQP